MVKEKVIFFIGISLSNSFLKNAYIKFLGNITSYVYEYGFETMKTTFQYNVL